MVPTVGGFFVPTVDGGPFLWRFQLKVNAGTESHHCLTLDAILFLVRFVRISTTPSRLP